MAFVFFQRLTPLQELQLLEIMCNYFQEQTKDSVRQVIFSSLFSPQGNKADDSRMALLGKLVSMAVAVCRVPVLECAAFWLQVQFLCRQGCLGEGVRVCSRVGTVNWGTAGHSQLLFPGRFSCLHVCACDHSCALASGRALPIHSCTAMEEKIVWVVFLLSVKVLIILPNPCLLKGLNRGFD